MAHPHSYFDRLLCRSVFFFFFGFTPYSGPLPRMILPILKTVPDPLTRHKLPPMEMDNRFRVGKHFERS